MPYAVFLVEVMDMPRVSALHPAASGWLALLMALLAMSAVTIFSPAEATRGIPIIYTPLNANLLQNPSAEQVIVPFPDGYRKVSIPHWRTTSNFTLVPYGASGFPTKNESLKFMGGVIFFAGGPDNSSSRASQVRYIDDLWRQIDAGKLKLTVSVWLAGWDGQRDSARVVVQFLDHDNKVVGTVRTAAVSATSQVFKKKAASAAVPIGTRSFKTILVAARGDGSYNDGYFDKIDVRLRWK